MVTTILHSMAFGLNRISLLVLTPMASDPTAGGADFTQLQTMADRAVAAVKIIAGGAISIGLLLGILLLATSVGNERRRAAGISALALALLGLVLFVGFTIFQSFAQSITGGL